MRPAGSPATEGMQERIPTVEEFGRWYQAAGAPRRAIIRLPGRSLL
jgi:hypothetical protein